MKILVVNFEYPPLGGGGGDVAKELSRQFVSHGHSVKVFTSWFPGLSCRSTEDGVDIKRVYAGRKNKATSSVFGMAKFLLFGMIPYLRFVKRERPDIVHVHFGVPTGFLGWLSWKFFGVPYVITGHLGDVPGAFPDQTKGLFPIIYPFTRPIWHNARCVTGVGESLTRLIRKAYPLVPAVFIPNGVDTDFFRSINKPKKSSQLKIFFASRLNPQKDLPTLFRALARVQAAHPDVDFELRIAGDGPMAEEWKKVGHELIGDHVKFLGWLDRDQILGEMQKSDLFVLSSVKEGMPIVCLQAMAVGLPLVCTAAEGTVEVVENGVNGLLVPIGNDEAMADALSSVVGDSDLRARLGAAGRDKAVRFFDWSVIAEQYLILFKEMILPRQAFFLPRLVTYNRGDLASRAGAIEAIRRTCRKAVLYMSTVEPETDAELYDILPVRTGWLKDFIPHFSAWKALRESKKILWVGGVDLQDDTSLIKIPYIALRFAFYRFLRKPIVIYSQGMGPIVTSWGAWWTRRVIAMTERVIVRDPDSKKILEKAGVTKAIDVAADAALSAQPSSSAAGAAILRALGFSMDRPIVGISVRRWFHHASDWVPYEYRARYAPKTIKGLKEMERLVSAVAASADSLVELYDADVLLVPMYPDQPEWWEDDGKIADTLKSRMRHADHARVYHGVEDPTTFASIISNLSFMIGMRLHSTIIATHQRVPAVHLRYSQKGLSYFQRNGQEGLVFPVDRILASEGPTEFDAFVQRIFLRREFVIKDLGQKMPAIEKLANESAIWALATK